MLACLTENKDEHKQLIFQVQGRIIHLSYSLVCGLVTSAFLMKVNSLHPFCFIFCWQIPERSAAFCFLIRVRDQPGFISLPSPLISFQAVSQTMLRIVNFSSHVSCERPRYSICTFSLCRRCRTWRTASFSAPKPWLMSLTNCWIVSFFVCRAAWFRKLKTNILIHTTGMMV